MVGNIGSRVRAPELTGRRWLNTGGRALSLRELRGRFVLVDFWTFCCINCLHVLDELRPLEEEFAGVLVTVGVHSPKFAHEGEPAAVAAAVQRYAVGHPVLDDPELATWQAYAVKAWPTLVLIDPEGYVVHVAAGEGHVDALRAILTELVAEHDRRGTLARGGGCYEPPPPADTVLRFPAKALAYRGHLLVADSAHHRIAELAGDGERLVRYLGSGRPGDRDGDAAVACFREPGAVAELPADVAARVGYHLVVADTANHLLRGVNVDTGTVSTVAGTGRQWRDGAVEGAAREVDLSSPWDVAWWGPARGVVIAMAGNHTLSTFDPVTGTVSRLAGTTVEGLNDGPAAGAHFAQPSGVTAAGDRLWLVDAETSALRYLDGSGNVHTVVGQGLFDFGHRDGPAGEALLQHPLGVAVLGDGVLIADTYNGAIRHYDTGTGMVSTLARDLAEPSDVLLVDGEIVVVESAAHRLVRPLLPQAVTVSGPPRQVRRPATDIAPGDLELAVVFTPPPGSTLDDRSGPSTRLAVSASPPELLTAGGGDGTDLTRTLRVAAGVEGGVLHVVAQAACCESTAEHPVCRMTRQDWGIPVRVRSDGATRLPLMLGGLDRDGGQ